MKTHDFPQYHATGYCEPTTVMLERVTHFYPVNYNGNSGTALVLDTGKEVLTSMRQWDVKKLFDD
ncbi:hypothetical protein DIR64_17080 [Salmonella enterica subsp. enterica serovar Tafo]|uniref:Uncharacterized protein n=2 Tax=Salmonella enterica TaxID=28901 RepID=A0A743HKV3_SALER|nr:hypothetical protein [Salmonella enterica]EDR0865822.1 hypothetical protein [Salmonella enterica subsp. enterica serovar Hillingdon]EDY8451004.1 hypothetical protein [Salmonella enterica subsp. enterica serovar Wangata]EEA5912665.1 hypothetical protein [Salmonella enterica subsp. enterica serovar Tafo]SQJ25045.1 Uncharacterised protein [Salmonella enterica subsp. enterica] [Salmonella enterica subsp. enterica serovar Menston]EAV9435602.1 hypothetical protein [Salmonella enterica]